MKRLLLILTLLVMGSMVFAQEQIDSAELGVYGTLTSGTTLEGQFESQKDMHLYTLTGAAGDVVTIQMVAVEGELDPALVMLGADGSLVGWNDDSNGEYNATIETQLPYDGVYFVLATTFRSLYEQQDIEGSYQITMVGASDISADSGITVDDLPALEPDQVYEGIALDAITPALLATLSVQDSLSVDLAAESDTLDTVLYVFGTNGERIALDDDSYGYAYSAGLQGVPLDEPGRYMIMVVTRNYEREQERQDVSGVMNLYVVRSS